MENFQIRLLNDEMTYSKQFIGISWTEYIGHEKVTPNVFHVKKKQIHQDPLSSDENSTVYIIYNI